MIRLPKRLAGMIPLRTHLHTVAHGHFQLVRHLLCRHVFVRHVSDPVAIYTRSKSDASGAASEFVARGQGWRGVSKMFPFRKMFPFLFPFRPHAKS